MKYFIPVLIPLAMLVHYGQAAQAQQPQNLAAYQQVLAHGDHHFARIFNGIDPLVPFNITRLHLAAAFKPTNPFAQRHRQAYINNLLTYIVQGLQNQYNNQLDQEARRGIIAHLINLPDAFGRTPLHYVALPETRSLAYMVPFLVGKGAQLDKQDAWGRTPLHYAALWENPAVLIKLLHALAHNPRRSEIINLQDGSGNTALHLALFENRNQCATILVHEGAATTLANNQGVLPHMIPTGPLLGSLFSVQQRQQMAQQMVQLTMQITQSQQHAPAATALANQQMAEQAILALHEYAQGKKRTREQEPCTICFDPTDDNGPEALELPCGHPFHQECLQNWFAQGKLSCPNCKQKVTAEALVEQTSANQ